MTSLQFKLESIRVTEVYREDTDTGERITLPEHPVTDEWFYTYVSAARDLSPGDSALVKITGHEPYYDTAYDRQLWRWRQFAKSTITRHGDLAFTVTLIDDEGKTWRTTRHGLPVDMVATTVPPVLARSLEKMKPEDRKHVFHWLRASNLNHGDDMLKAVNAINRRAVERNNRKPRRKPNA